MRAFVLLVATGAVLAAPGCFGGEEREDEGRPEPRLVDTTEVEGGSPRERALLRNVTSGMERSALERITIAAPEARRRTDDGKQVIGLTFTPVAGETTRRQWDQWIVAGAFSRRLLAAGLPSEVDAGDDRARFTALPRLEGQPDPPALTREREAAIVRGIRDAARDSGGEIVRLEVHRPYGVAVALTLSSEDPAGFLESRLRQLLQKLDVYRPRLEGLYLAVVGPDRRLAMEWGTWTRNRAGSYWVRRDLTNCSPIRQSEPPGSEPAPDCPA